MIDSYRTEPLDMKVVCENIVNGINKYVNDNKLKCVVIGLSGGLDSTVCAALCKLANVPIIGVSLPCTTNEDCEKTSATLGGTEFCDAFKEINLQPMFESMEKFCTETSGVESTPISQGNIKARLRMITLYDIASKNGGIVIGTSNKTEWLTGFWTLHGDIGDINPIGELWKTEVYTLADYININKFNGKSEALNHAVALIPTDGNGVKNGGDAEQIMPGNTYKEIDHVLSNWDNLSDKIKPKYAADGLTNSIKNTIFDIEDEDVKKRRMEYCEKANKDFVPNLGDLYGVESVRKVCMRSWNSGFKRKTLEICINLDNGEILFH